MILIVTQRDRTADLPRALRACAATRHYASAPVAAPPFRLFNFHTDADILLLPKPRSVYRDTTQVLSR